MNKTSIIFAALAASMTFSTLADAATTNDRRGRSESPENELGCDVNMGFLRHLYPQEIRSILNERVVIIPVCEDLPPSKNIALLFTDEGNASGLHRQIAANVTLASALAGKNYQANDVLGVRKLDTSVILYVHRER